ncbi:MAG: isopentenyl-diphosphate Delta-isomerase [Bacteroidia bacterium]|nr:isopentenyl-diphosphate Delta-isomerase [Bacteroidia bacterium]
MQEPQVILVDSEDREMGSMGKQEAHEKGLLHRAISVFLFDPSGRMLLQKRALEKYHSPGLWTNTVCSHPAPGENSAQAALRRLKEEMGISADLLPAFTFTYKAEFENGLTEHELDHVFLGKWEGSPQPDPAEIAAWRWIHPDDLLDEVARKPENFTVWFRIILERVLEVKAEMF